MRREDHAAESRPADPTDQAAGGGSGSETPRGRERSRFEQVLFRLKTYVTEQKIDVPECFISYAWGNPEHERWVESRWRPICRRRASRWCWIAGRTRASARACRGSWRRVGKCDRVIVVGTPLYRKKYENDEPMRGFVRRRGGRPDRQTDDRQPKRRRRACFRCCSKGPKRHPFRYLLHGRVYADFRADRQVFRHRSLI